MKNGDFNGILKKELPKDFNKMKDVLGDERYDILNIVTGTLLSDAVVFMKDLGVLDEFLENKNIVSHQMISSILENRNKSK